MHDLDTERRLAAIVAVDMAGYSRRTETDQAEAVRAVAALSRLAQTVTAEHGGRVFNTAGDGFMLEFPTASGALEAAAALSAQAGAPVRIGVHLGEVHLTANGDLLGHGVNVAARLQALAEPGAILVSDDVRRAARGSLAVQLQPQGRVRLDKMREKALIHALRPPGAAPARAMRRARPRVLWAVAGAAAAALLGGLGYVTMQAPRGSALELKTAVRDFSVQDGAADSRFGAAVADSVAAALGGRQAQTVSRDLVRRGDTGHARLLVGGEISQAGDNLRIHAHIDDAKAGVILWAADFERPKSQLAALQDTTATKLADLIDLVRQDAATSRTALDANSLTALMRAEDISRLTAIETGDEKRAAWRRVIALAPTLARAHSGLAYFDLNDLFLSAPPPPVEAQRRAEAKAQIKAALALDPHNGEAYVAGSLLPAVDDFAGQEDWLVRGLAVDPANATLNYNEADVVRHVGRLTEGLALARRSLDADPLSRSRTEAVVFALIGVGQLSEARALNDRARRMWSDYPTAQVAQLTLDLIYGDQTSGEAVLAAAERGEIALSPVSIAAFRKVLAARAGRLPAAAAAQTLVRAAVQDQQLDLGLEIAALSQLGQVDTALAELDRRLAMRARFFFSTLYEPSGSNLRQSPKFIALGARYGLTRYWLKTGKWPDFCADPSLPYDCKATAAKL